MEKLVSIMTMNNSSPSISIVLPCYNGATHLAASIESVISQTYKHWELIIVNDCSTDNSLDIMHEFEEKDSRIRIINNEQNLKLPASLNRGFSEAQGKYLTWTSHDNRMAPNMLEEMVAYMETHPDIGLVTANYAAYSLSSGEHLYDVSMPDPQKNLPRFNTICYAFMYRREVMETIGGYDEHLFLIEDYEYWIRIWLNFKIGKIDKVLYYTGVGDTTLTMSRKKEIAQKLLEVRLMYFDDFSKALADNSIQQRDYHISIADELLFLKRVKFCLKCACHNPIQFGAYYYFWHAPKKLIRDYSIYKKFRFMLKKVFTYFAVL